MIKADYRENFRIRVTEMTINKYRDLIQKEKIGERQLYRSKKEISEHRAARRLEGGSTNWYKAKGFNV